jgi:hypothetical protein
VRKIGTSQASSFFHYVSFISFDLLLGVKEKHGNSTISQVALFRASKTFGSMGALITKISSDFLWTVATSVYDHTFSSPYTETGSILSQPDSLKEAITITATATAPIFGSKQTASTSPHRTDIMYSNALSRGRASRSNSFDSYDDEVHIPNIVHPQEPLESTDNFRVVQKKPKKLRRGRCLDLAATDSNSDTATSSSRANSASPSPSKFHLRPLNTSDNTEISQEDQLVNNETPSRGSQSIRSQIIGSQLPLEHHGEHCFDTNPTPTQARFNSDPTPTQAHFDFSQILTPTHKTISSVEAHEIDPAEVSDTESTKDRTKEVMSQLSMAFGGITHAPIGKDAFDSVEWDPELPTAGGAESPEPIAVKLQPIAYTTVGSLVDPNAKPQFSAPNRIQREGAVRQPLLSIMNASQRPYDSFYQNRGPPPPLSMANSMAYAQNIAKSPVHVSSTQNLTPPETSSQSSRMDRNYQLPKLTEKEVDVLKKMQLAQLNSNSISRSIPGTPTPSSSSKLSAVAPTFEKKELLLDRARGLSSSAMETGFGAGFAGGGTSEFDETPGTRPTLDRSSSASIAASVASFDNALTKLVTGNSRRPITSLLHANNS